MAFQTPITVKAALERIQKHEYVLPAIQREFVWSADQICRLFDSLMRGYPIGSFLFWRVEPSRVRDFTYYGFLRDYHQRDAFHLPRLDVPDRAAITAILDGQQRLTSLNIGLRGSHAERLPRRWANNPLAYPRRLLYLNVAALAPENELGMDYDFQFLEPERAQAGNSPECHWFKVSDIYELSDASDIFEYIQTHGLANNRDAFRMMNRLHAVVTSERVINFFEEDEQDLDKVLNIFIRVNSGGTVLSYSDLLLSIAIAQWKSLDAREVVHRLVDDLNATGHGYKFSKDIVLKAGLVLSDIPSIRFSVTNFNADNMAILETSWTHIATALRLGVQLLSDFGLSERTLTADSVLIPIAYYLHKHGVDERYLMSHSTIQDREAIRAWVVRSLLKAGVWGSGLDTLLTNLRAVIREREEVGFPVTAAETAMTRLGKSLRFESDEVQDLMNLPYGDKRVFLVLSLLYPGMDLRHEFHVDHVFPQSLFTRRQLTSEGFDPSAVDRLADQFNRLPNLQLMEGAINTSKSNKLPLDWLDYQYGDQSARDFYRVRHDLGDVPDSVHGFSDFYGQRRDRMASRLRQVLGAAPAE